MSTHRHARRPDVQAEIDLGFASQRWRNFVVKRRPEVVVDRRALEVCVFIHLAAALQIGDFYVVGAENFADYRAQLLPWSECEPRLPVYCAALGIPERGEDFAAMLKAEFTAAATAVDADLLDNTELSIGEDGTPHLRQMVTKSPPAGLADFEQEVRARMPERHLLDILKHAEHWSRHTRHSGPQSGADPKLAQAVQRYLRSSRRVSRDNGMREQAKNITVPQTWQTIVGRRRFVRRIPWTVKLPLNGRCRSRPECGQLRDSRVNSTMFTVVPA